nr:FXYD domain-containing ion transport regulator 3 isoform X1 [Vulpes vulpes]
MQKVVLSLLIFLAAGLPALEANDPEDKDSPFYYDWQRLRIGGLICAAVLCTIGIIVLMSEWGPWWPAGRAALWVPSPKPFLLPQQVGNANASSARSPGKMGSLRVRFTLSSEHISPVKRAKSCRKRPPSSALENSRH